MNLVDTVVPIRKVISALLVQRRKVDRSEGFTQRYEAAQALENRIIYQAQSIETGLDAKYDLNPLPYSQAHDLVKWAGQARAR